MKTYRLELNSRNWIMNDLNELSKDKRGLDEGKKEMSDGIIAEMLLFRRILSEIKVKKLVKENVAYALRVREAMDKGYTVLPINARRWMKDSFFDETNAFVSGFPTSLDSYIDMAKTIAVFSDLFMTASTSPSPPTNPWNSSKLAVIDTMMELDDEDYYRLFNGMHQVSGSGERYRLALDWLLNVRDSRFHRTITVVVTFGEKPRSMLAFGMNKKGEAKGKAIDPRLALLLPQLSEDEFDAMRESKLPEDMKSMVHRMKLPVEFQRVNFSRSRALHHMFCDRLLPDSYVHPSLSQLKSIYASPLSNCVFTLEQLKGSPETLRIKTIAAQEMKRWNVIWNSSEARARILAKVSSSECGPRLKK